MNKTLNYYIENYATKLIAVVIGIVFYYHPLISFFKDDTFFDKVLTLSTTVFGFLLTVLTLIVQSDGPTMLKMKQNKSYNRLIKYNKEIVYASGLLSLFSILIIVLNNLLYDKYFSLLLFLCSFGVLVLVFLILDSLKFLFLFYRIILKDSE